MDKYIFIDESGDPVFHGHRKRLLVDTVGFQPYLIMGLIETGNRRLLHNAVVNFMNTIKADSLYNTIPSVASDKGWYVHARGDHPELRAKFFELIRGMEGFKAHIVIAKKDLTIFNERHNGKPIEFYFDVLHHLLDGKLADRNCMYKLYLSQRGNNSLHQFEAAVAKAIKLSEPENSVIAQYKLEIVPGKAMPELSIIDYLIWAVQRKLLTGERRYFDAVKEKFETITYLYGEETN